MMKATILTLIFLYPTLLLGGIKILELNDASFGECDGEVRIEALGSAGPFTIAIINESGNLVADIFDNINGDVLFSNLCPGDFTIVIDGVEFCEKLLTVTIEEVKPDCMSSTLQVVFEEVSCVGIFIAEFSEWTSNYERVPGVVKIDIQGGYPFSGNRYYIEWSTGRSGYNLNEIEIYDPGEYFVTISDYAGCSVTNTFIIGDQEKEINISPIHNHSNTIACNLTLDKPGKLKINIPENDEYKIVWSNGVEDRNEINYYESGTYCVTVTDNCGKSEEYCEEVVCSSGLVSNCDQANSKVHLSQTFPCHENSNLITSLWKIQSKIHLQVYNFVNPRTSGSDYIYWEGLNEDNITEVVYGGTLNNPSFVIKGKEELKIENPGTYEVVVVSKGCATSYTFNFGQREMRNFYVSDYLPIGSYYSYPYKGTSRCSSCDLPNDKELTRSICTASYQSDSCPYTSPANCNHGDPNFTPFNFVPNDPLDPCGEGGKLYFRNKYDDEINHILIDDRFSWSSIYLAPGTYNDAEFDCQGNPGCFFSNIGFDRPVFVAICDNFEPPIDDILNTDEDLDNSTAYPDEVLEMIENNPCENYIIEEENCFFSMKCLDLGNEFFVSTNTFERCIKFEGGKILLYPAYCPAEEEGEDCVQWSDYFDITDRPEDEWINEEVCSCENFKWASRHAEAEVRSLDVIQQSNSQIKIFPNPTSGNINLSLKGIDSESLSLKVIDLQGKTFLFEEFRLDTDHNSYDIELNSLIPGLYIVIVQSENIFWTEKLIVSR